MTHRAGHELERTARHREPPGGRTVSDARAPEDSVVLSIDSLALFGLVERHPRLARRWLVSLAQRSSDIQMRLVDLLAGGLEAQIASVLIHQSEHGVVRLSQATLADLVGARRTSVNRVLKRLEADGVVGLRYGQVDIVDATALLAHAGIPVPAPSVKTTAMQTRSTSCSSE